MKLTSLLMMLSIAVSLPAQTAAPDFTLPDLDGQNYKLSENFGKGPILINFWATWCVPCLAEMKKLKELHAQYQPKGLTILSISIDDPKTVSKVMGFVNSNRYPFKFLLDTNLEVFKRYHGVNPPLSVLLDKAGRIVFTHMGYRKGDEKKLAEEIAKLVP